MTIDQLVNEDEALEMFLEGRAVAVKPKHVQRNWSWMDTPGKARQYYEENFKGMARGEVQKGIDNSGRSFYHAVMKRGWLDNVFPPSKNSGHADWSWMDTPEKAREYYDDNFPGMTRSQVNKCTDTGGRSFHQAVRVRGWLDNVFPPSMNTNHADWSWMDTPKKARQYYEDNFKGKSRGWIMRDKDGGGRSFYVAVPKEWRDEVFPPDARSDWSGMDTPEKARQYYEVNFNGMQRSEVAQDRENNGLSFYALVQKRGWLDRVFPPSKARNHKDWSWMDTAEKARGYYEQHFKGRTRHQVAGDTANSGSGFYHKVGEMGWTDQVFPPSLRPDWSWMDTPEKARQYYEDNYKGMSRTKVQTDTKNGGRGFFKAVPKEWRDQVFPPSRRKSWSWMDTPDKARQHYEDNYKGMSRNKLAEDTENGGKAFYHAVQNQGWTDHVFPPRMTVDWSWMDTPEKARKHYECNYDGMTRTQVAQDTENGGQRFYAAVPKEWRDEVFPPSRRGKRT